MTVYKTLSLVGLTAELALFVLKNKCSEWLLDYQFCLPTYTDKLPHSLSLTLSLSISLSLTLTLTLTLFNSLVSVRCGSNCKSMVIVKRIIPNNSLDTSCEIALKWIAQILTDKKLIFVRVMTWCRQATNKQLPDPMLTHRSHFVDNIFKYTHLFCVSLAFWTDKLRMNDIISGKNVFRIELNSYHLKLNTYYLVLNIYNLELNSYCLQLNAYHLELCCAVVVCAKFCNDVIAYNGVTLK